jgi:DMSO/TMAO reductase YedYZ molybdopterin-dependent catalytic subunit
MTAPAARPAPAASAPAAPWWTGAMVGFLSLAAGLVTGEVLAGWQDSWRSPVVSVGDRVVDGVPRPVKNWAIDTFGTNDKVVLITGTVLILMAAACVLGVLAVRRSLAVGLWGVAGFTAVGAAASLGRGGSGVFAPVPALVAGGVAAGVMVLLTRLARAGWVPVAEGSAAVVDDRAASMRALQSASRRTFLKASMAVGVSSLVIGRFALFLQQQASVAAERLKVVLPRPSVPAPAVPAAVSVDVPGVTPFITPNADFYRIDTALTVPRVGVEDWTLSVTGDVDRPLRITYEELLDRPMVESVATIACVSNEIGGDLIGTARWLGCRLDDLLDEAGVQPRADQIVGVSVDGFTAGFPTEVLDGRDALVVVGMNGEPLPTDHGFPARLVVPGLYGYVSATKWLEEIRLTRFDEFEGYWIPRGWSAEGPVKTQSRIDTPRSGSTVESGVARAIAGVAWAPLKAVTRVEVQVDDGPWRDAELGEEYSSTTWRQWKVAWTPEPGEHTIRVRATDGTGETQTSEVTDVAPDGATGWHTIEVRAD